MFNIFYKSLSEIVDRHAPLTKVNLKRKIFTVETMDK